MYELVGGIFVLLSVGFVLYIVFDMGKGHHKKTV